MTDLDSFKHLSRSIDVIVSGHLCMDLIPHMATVTAQALITPGAVVEVGPMAFATGGPVSNSGLTLHRLGVNVRLMASVGDDLIGQAILSFLKATDESLGQFISVIPGQATSYSIVLSPELSDRTFLHCTGQNSTFDSHSIDYELLKQAKILHLGYPPLLPTTILHGGVELRKIFQRAKETEITTSLDMSRPDPNSLSGQVNWDEILRNVLPYVDVFIPSIEEILFMTRRQDYETWHGKVLTHLTRPYLASLAQSFLDIGSAIVGFKLGEMGFYLRTAHADRLRKLTTLPINPDSWANIELWAPAFQTQVVGTTGAGDAAYAGFLTGLLQGLSPQETTKLACAVGAFNVEASDSTSGIRSLKETKMRLEAGWTTRSERLSGF